VNLDDEVRRLVATESLKVLKARYFRFVDLEDWDAFRELFTEDATFDVEGNVIDGRADFLDRVVEHHTLAEVRSVHHGHMPELTVRDDGTASGVWAMVDYVDRIWRADGRREALVGYGHYHEEYVETGDGWRIRSMALVRIRVDRLPAPLEPFPHRSAPPASVLPPASG
jgi:hypothetical protein